VPSGLEHPLLQDEVHVALLLDAEGYADVHLGAHRALAHAFLGRPLGGGHEGHGRGVAEPGDRVGVLERDGRLLGPRGYHQIALRLVVMGPIRWRTVPR